MIIVRIVGGLASQLHKYAIGQALASQHGTSLKLDLTWFENRPESDTPWAYELDKFNIAAVAATTAEVRQVRGNPLFNRILDKIERTFKCQIPGRRWIRRSFVSLDDFRKIPDNVYLDGEWVGDSYFRHIRPELLTAFKPRNPLSQKANQILNEIQADPFSVAVHVRRGDFITNPTAQSFHCLTPLDYYLVAIQQILSKHENASFFLFSDDLHWLQTELYPRIRQKARVVADLENHEDFYLMSKCKGNILSNSGFGWTAAWLNDYIDRMAIAPKNWLRDPEQNRVLLSQLFTDGWAQLL